jgi:hypothetical protein
MEPEDDDRFFLLHIAINNKDQPMLEFLWNEERLCRLWKMNKLALKDMCKRLIIDSQWVEGMKTII